MSVTLIKSGKLFNKIALVYPTAEIHSYIENNDTWKELIVPYGYVCGTKIAVQYEKNWIVKDSEIRKNLEGVGLKCQLNRFNAN
jgi:hypothetical protein